MQRIIEINRLITLKHNRFKGKSCRSYKRYWKIKLAIIIRKRLTYKLEKHIIKIQRWRNRS